MYVSVAMRVSECLSYQTDINLVEIGLPFIYASEGNSHISLNPPPCIQKTQDRANNIIRIARVKPGLGMVDCSTCLDCGV